MIKNIKNRTLIIKLVFGLALLFFISKKIWNEPILDHFYSIEFKENAVLYFIVFFFLMFVNWSLETIKWQVLMKEVKTLQFKTALLSVLAGISTGLLTPNRIGNFIGRTVYLDEKIKSKVTLLTFLGNMAQFTATLIMGLIGFETFGRNQLSIEPLIIEITALILVLTALYFYFNPKKIKFLKRFFNSNILEGIDFVQEIDNFKKLKILLLSLVRYLVFLSQYYLLLVIFKVEIQAIILLSAISLIFLITTLIPSLLFGKLFVREASAIFVLTEMGITTPVILLSVFILWLINLALPSFIGAFILIRKK